MIPRKSAFLASLLLTAGLAAALLTATPVRADDDHWRGERGRGAWEHGEWERQREWQAHMARERWDHERWERAQHYGYPYYQEPRVVYVQPPPSGFTVVLPLHFN